LISQQSEDIIIQLLEDYYNLDNKRFAEELEQKFTIFEDLDNIKDPRIQAIGNFLYSIGLAILSDKIGLYRYRDFRKSFRNKAYDAILKAYTYFKETDELKLLEHIYDQLIFLLWDQIPRRIVTVDEKLKLYKKLIEYCKKQEEISEKLGDDAFLKKDERIPFRYILGEFRYLLEKGIISPQEAIDSNNQLIEKIKELEQFDFPKAKFWARKWNRKNVCFIKENNELSFSGSTLCIDGEDITFTNNDYNRSITFKLYLSPKLEIKEQKAYPEMRFLRVGLTFLSVNPRIERTYEDDLILNYRIEHPQKSKGDPFARDMFSIIPQKSLDKNYVFIIETSSQVEIQENATLLIQDDTTLKINICPFETIEKEDITLLKFKLIRKRSDTKGPKSKILDKEELDFMGIGQSINFTLYCNINPTFSGVFIFTDPSNWKYCLSSCLYINKLKYRQKWYPQFLNFDYTPIQFLENGRISEKFFKIVDNNKFSGFLNDIGKEFPGLLNQILIFGEFMVDYSLEDRKKELMNLIQLMTTLSGGSGLEESNIIIITSDKDYYEEMKKLEDELNTINQKLNRTYKTSTTTAFTVKYIENSQFLSETSITNKKIYDHDFEDIYIVDDPVIAFILLPLVKYTQSAIIVKDELDSEIAKKILTKAKQIWAIGNFKEVKIPKKASSKLNIIEVSDYHEHIMKINKIFKEKIEKDFEEYSKSEYLQRVYPGYDEINLLNNCILTSFSENDYSFLTLASNYGANKPATIWVIKEDDEFNKNEKVILNKLGTLRFDEENEITQNDISEIGKSIKQSIHKTIQNGIENSENIIIISKIPIPFELYSYESSDKEIPLCIIKRIGRICSTDIIDTSIMLTFNMLRRMVSKIGEKVLIIAPKYEGIYELKGAITEANNLKNELNEIFKGAIISKIDELIDKNWFFDNFKSPLKIIHFSGHGHFIDDKSCLILSTPKDGDPEFLFPDDLDEYVEKEGLIRGYPLVFTSACITGKVQKSGSGLEGLAAQFIKSGATCFIGTLWEIMDESARILATHIYNNLQQVDKNLGELLLEARIKLNKKSQELLKKENFYDPTCYAFILFGDPTIKLR